MNQWRPPRSSALTLWVFPVFLCLLPAMPVQAQVTCSATVSPVSFGSVDLLAGTGLTTTANLTYTCQNTANSTQTATVCFSIGDPHGAYYSNRWIDKGAERLYFQMYQDSAYTQIWGTVFGGAVTPPKITVSISRRSTTSPATLTVYSRIGAAQTVSSGAYVTPYGAGDTRITLSTGSNTTCQGTDSGSFSFNVSATVIKSCTVTASTLDFGTPSGSLTTNIDSTTTVQATCSNTTPYQIGLDNGQNASGITRRMAGGSSEFVNYELYRDAGRTLRWGNTSPTDTIAGTGTGSPQLPPVTVYGRVPPQTTPSPGSYGDTITVNVTY